NIVAISPLPRRANRDRNSRFRGWVDVAAIAEEPRRRVGARKGASSKSRASQHSADRVGSQPARRAVRTTLGAQFADPALRSFFPETLGAGSCRSAAGILDLAA